jgi:molecular chaperone GrpE
MSDHEFDEKKKNEGEGDSKSKDKKRVVIEFDRAAKPSSGPSASGTEFGPDVLDLDAADATGSAESILQESSAQSAQAPLGAQVARLKAEKDELTKTMMRRQADFENYRKRIERDREEEQRRGVARLLTDLITVLDAFERALKAHDDPAYEEYRKGLELIYRQMWETLARHGLERIAAAGAIFDPHFHQAIERVETREHPDGAILEVFQDGYLFHGRVLRPSIVRVAVHTDGSDRDETSVSRHRTN